MSPLSVIIPSLNPTPALIGLVEQVQAALPTARLLLVDDGDVERHHLHAGAEHRVGRLALRRLRRQRQGRADGRDGRQARQRSGSGFGDGGCDYRKAELQKRIYR